MKCIAIFLTLLVSTSCWAFCYFSESLLGTLREESALTLYKSCAEGMNDDMAQAKLAGIYDKGTTAVPKDIQKALYYYQLSADNGNAESQARLAQMYMELDRDREGRRSMHEYMNTIIPMPALNGNYHDDFKGEFIHPYVLLLLANEKAANKWYYPTKVKQAPAYASNLFKNYKIDDEKRKLLMKQATAWKRRKLLEMARQILSEAEYREFSDTLYPANGQVDAFKRSQLLKAFQEKMALKQQQDQENAKAFY